MAGAAQEQHDEDVVNLGWNAPADDIANPLVGRLPNEELWLLIRRFDKVNYIPPLRLSGTKLMLL